MECKDVGKNVIQIHDKHDKVCRPRSYGYVTSPCEYCSGSLSVDQYPTLEGITTGQLWVDYDGNVWVENRMVLEISDVFSIAIQDTSRPMGNDHFIRPSTFMFWYLGVPMEYITDSGWISWDYYDTLDPEDNPPRRFGQALIITPAQLPESLQSGYNWLIDGACDYIRKMVIHSNRKATLVKEITMNNLDELANIKYSAPTTHVYELITPGPGGAVLGPEYTEADFAKYAAQLLYIVSDDAEAWAIYTGRMESGGKI
jgi:hypothetical protein